MGNPSTCNCEHAPALHIDGRCAYANCKCKSKLFDAERGMALRDAGMQRAELHADSDWKTLALEAAYWCASTHSLFTSDDVWARMISLDPDNARTREPRALGSIISKLHRDKVIRPTGHYIPSNRPETHRNPKRQWEPVNDK